jgi:hypothetical protein
MYLGRAKVDGRIFMAALSRVVCRSFAAALTHISTTVTPPAPATSNFGVGLRRPCWIKYLWRTTSGAAGSGVGTMIKYLRDAAESSLGATTKYLRRTPRQVPRASTCDAKRLAPRATASAPRSRSCAVPRAASAAWAPRSTNYLRRTTRQRPGHHDQVPAKHNERRHGQQHRHHDQVPATHNERPSLVNTPLFARKVSRRTVYRL